MRDYVTCGVRMFLFAKGATKQLTTTRDINRYIQPHATRKLILILGGKVSPSAGRGRGETESSLRPAPLALRAGHRAGEFSLVAGRGNEIGW